MKTVIIEYAKISPALLSHRVESSLNCLTRFTDIDEDYFEFSVFCCRDMAGLENILAKYV